MLRLLRRNSLSGNANLRLISRLRWRSYSLKGKVRNLGQLSGPPLRGGKTLNALCRWPSPLHHQDPRSHCDLAVFQRSHRQIPPLLSRFHGLLDTTKEETRRFFPHHVQVLANHVRLRQDLRVLNLPGHRENGLGKRENSLCSKNTSLNISTDATKYNIAGLRPRSDQAQLKS